MTGGASRRENGVVIEGYVAVSYQSPVGMQSEESQYDTQREGNFGISISTITSWRTPGAGLHG